MIIFMLEYGNFMNPTSDLHSIKVHPMIPPQFFSVYTENCKGTMIIITIHVAQENLYSVLSKMTLFVITKIPYIQFDFVYHHHLCTKQDNLFFGKLEV